MEGPAYSLFHGGENIRVNTSDIDDEEALERHKSVSYLKSNQNLNATVLYKPAALRSKKVSTTSSAMIY